MTRLEKFANLEHHAWYKRQWVKLNAGEIGWCRNWIGAHDNMSKNQFESAVNRLWVDRANEGSPEVLRVDKKCHMGRPKMRHLMAELIASSNV